jgi:hypothetical protein
LFGACHTSEFTPGDNRGARSLGRASNTGDNLQGLTQ